MEPVITHAVFQVMRAVPRILVVGAVLWSRRIVTLSLNFAGEGVMGNAVKTDESEREDKLGIRKKDGRLGQVCSLALGGIA